MTGTLLCLGYRPGFVLAARERGLDPHFIVETVKPGLEGLAYTKVSDLADSEEVLRAALAAGHGFQGVVTGHEQALFTAAVLRSALGLPGDTDILRCLRFRDKQLQKRSLSPAIPRARCRYLPRSAPSFARVTEELGTPGRPIVVKPADGFGSRATSVIRDQAQLDEYADRFPVKSDVQTVAESFVDGTEIHVDGIWERGAPRWQAVSAYLCPLMGWTDGAPVADAPLPPDESGLNQRARAFAGQVLADLDAPDCVFHLEAFAADDGTLLLGEVAARMVGALTPDTLRRTYGIDLYGASVDLGLGRSSRLPGPAEGDENGLLYGWVYLTRDPGRDLSEKDFLRRFDLVEVDYPAAGQGGVGSYGRWGHAVAAAATHADLMNILRAVAAFNQGQDG